MPTPGVAPRSREVRTFKRAAAVVELMTDGSRDGDRPRGPPPRHGDRNEAESAPEVSSGFGPDDPDGPGEWLRWLANTDHGGVAFVREMLVSVGAVLLVGLLLFGISGIWPPMVAVESTSMQPHLGVGDLVFVMEKDRFPPAAAHGDTGVVTAERGAEAGYRTFGDAGDVVVYRPDGRIRSTPIIHRAMFWVDDGENWYDRADPDYVARYGDCETLPNCPAPHAGFITKGDNEATNGAYDQVNGLSAPVKPEWIVGTAELRIPLMGYVKLCVSGGPCPMTAVAPVPGFSAVGSGVAPGAEPAPASVSMPSTDPNGPSPPDLAA